jgi:hypothetical protein
MVYRLKRIIHQLSVVYLMANLKYFPSCFTQISYHPEKGMNGQLALLN